MSARELKAGFQCEYMKPSVGGKRERCTVKHHERIDGKPQQLLPVKEENKTRFMCKEHAAFFSIAGTRPKQKKSAPPPEQISLL